MQDYIITVYDFMEDNDYVPLEFYNTHYNRIPKILSIDEAALYYGEDDIPNDVIF